MIYKNKIISIEQKLLDKEQQLNSSKSKHSQLGDDFIHLFSHPDFSFSFNSELNINNISFNAWNPNFNLKIFINIDRENKKLDIRYRTQEDSILNSNFKQYVNMCDKIESIFSNINFDDFYQFFNQYLTLTKNITKFEKELSIIKKQKLSLDNEKNLKILESYFGSSKHINHDKDSFNNNNSHSKELLFFEYRPDKDRIFFNLKTLLKRDKIYYFKITNTMYSQQETKISKKAAMQMLDRQIFINGNLISNFEDIPLIENFDKESRVKDMSISMEDFNFLIKKVSISLRCSDFLFIYPFDNFKIKRTILVLFFILIYQYSKNNINKMILVNKKYKCIFSFYKCELIFKWKCFENGFIFRRNVLSVVINY